jgi:hypothetical protein
MAAARHFTAASTDSITLSLGNLAFNYGPGSMAFIINATTLGGTVVPFSAGATNTIGYRIQTAANGLLNSVLNGTGSAMTSPTMVTGSWYLVGHCKATGTATPKLHVYDYGASTWTHQNGSGTQANSSIPVTRAAFGAIQATGNNWDGDILMGAVWNVQLTDLQFEQLAYDRNAWFASAAPVAYWELYQDATTQSVTDATGGGANQSAISGTSISAAVLPPIRERTRQLTPTFTTVPYMSPGRI